MSLKCKVLNARSVVNNVLDLHTLFKSEDLDILAITETSLSSDIETVELINSNYTVYRKDRNRYGGGIMVLIRSALQVTRRLDLETDCELDKCMDWTETQAKPLYF